MSGVSIATGVVAVDPTDGSTALTGTTITATTKFLGASGVVGAPTFGFSADPTTGAYQSLAGTIDFTISNSRKHAWQANTYFMLSDAASISMGSGQDLVLARDAANILACRGGTNAQTFRVYNTFTDASNFERGFAGWNGNVFIIGTEFLGTGSTRALSFSTNGSQRWQVTTSGHLAVIADNTYDIGGSITTRVRDLYLNGGAGGNATTGAVGEYVSSTIASGSAVSLTTATTANMTSISLTAGDWEVSGVICLKFGATTSFTNLSGGISTVSATLPSQEIQFDYEAPATVPTAGKDMSWVLPTTRISVSGTTTVYAPVNCTFTVSTLTTYGILRARRVR